MTLLTSGPQVADSVRSVERALHLLSALERASHPMGVSDLARATNMPNSTAQRLLYVLERHGFVQKELKRYYLGAAVVPLARAYLSVSSVASAAQPALEELAVTTGESVSLYVRDGNDRVLLQRIESPYTLRIAERVGIRLPLHLGAAGHILLAHMPTAEIDRYLDSVGEMHLYGGAVLSRDSLLAKLEQVRRSDFAVSHSERRAGVVAVSVPVRRQGLGVVAAIAISGPSMRMTPERVEQLIIEAQNAADQVVEASRHR